MKRRRVLLMISSMRGGGSERQTLLLLKYLDRSRFEPHLYLTEKAGDLLAEIPNDVPIHSFAEQAKQTRVYFPGRIFRQQVAHLHELLRSQTIDVVYDRTFQMSMIAGPACVSLGIPRVSTIVSPPEYAVPLVEKRFIHWKRRRLVKAYRQSKSIVAVSRMAAISAESYYGIEPGCILVIPNPVDREAIHSSLGPRIELPRDRIRMICVGRMTVEKGQADLIEALSISESKWPIDAPCIAMSFVGDGPLRESLQSQAISKVHRHSVEFLGIDPHPASRIASADALILPSHFEGMPNVVLEAMALGTPVIATRAGGTLELERMEPTILWAEPRDPESLSRAILEFVKDPMRGEQRVAAARRLVNEHHGVEKITRQIECLLK